MRRKPRQLQLSVLNNAIYNAFDKLAVLYQGRQTILVPAMDAEAYFTDIAPTRPPTSISTADFLTVLEASSVMRSGCEDDVPRGLTPTLSVIIAHLSGIWTL